MKSNIYCVLILLFAVGFMSSCGMYEQSLLIRGVKDGELIVNSRPDYLLIPGYELIIDVKSSIDPDVTGEFGESKRFAIALDGMITLPIVGSIHIGGKKLSEAISEIRTELDRYFVDSFINIRLAGIDFSIIGSCIEPGNYRVPEETLTIFDALSKAKGFNRNANKEEVVLIRQYIDGRRVHIIDFSNRDILTGEFYYIYPKDEIYIPPSKKFFLSRNRETLSHLKFLVGISSAFLIAFLAL